MSLLLDALKKAAQEKLDRQSREPQSRTGAGDPEPTQFDSGEVTRTELPDQPTRTEHADNTDASALDSANPTEFAADPTSLADDDFTRNEATRPQRTEMPDAGGTELELEPVAGDDRERRLDTTGFDPDSTETGSPNEPGSGLTTDELDAYLAAGDARTTQRPGGDQTGFSDSQEHTDPTYRQSLTENFRMEHAAYGYPSPGTPEQAARIFSSKSPPAANRTRLFVLIGLAAVAALLLGGLFGYDYIAGMEQSDMVYAGSRPRLGESSTSHEPVAERVAEPAPDEDVDPALLIEQEDYSELFRDTVAEYESETGKAAPTSGRTPPRAEPSADNRPAAPARRAAPAPRQTVAGRSGEYSIQRGRSAGGEPLKAVLMRGWDAYNRGDLDTAEVAYRQALSRSPRNRDALLGLAAIAQVSGETGAARDYYRRLLELNPRDDLALAGLTGLTGGGRNTANRAPREISGIKTLLSERPEAPHLHFTLGNLFAAEGRWADAQQAYFDAYRLSDDNPDYAFNLAVSLEHLGQPEGALRFYREALRSSENRRANFQPAALQSRIDSLIGNHAASQTQQ